MVCLIYQIKLNVSAEKFLYRLRDQKLVERLREAIRKLRQNPWPTGSTKIVGSAAKYRVRVGDYRIVYEVHDRILVVVVITIGHRREVYR